MSETILLLIFLVMLIDKTAFYKLYGWLFSPHLATKAARPKPLEREALKKADEITTIGPKLFGQQGKDDSD